MFKAVYTKDNKLYIDMTLSESTTITTSIPQANGITLLNELKRVLMNSGERFISFSGIETKEDLQACFPEDYEKLEKIFNGG